MNWLFVLPMTLISVILGGLFWGWIVMKIFGEQTAKYAFAALGGYTLAEIKPTNELAMNIGIGLGLVPLAAIVFRKHPSYG